MCIGSWNIHPLYAPATILCCYLFWRVSLISIDESHFLLSLSFSLSRATLVRACLDGCSQTYGWCFRLSELTNANA